mgnify:FL=1
MHPRRYKICFTYVSIPYRRNERKILKFCVFQVQGFQFLIGAMKGLILLTASITLILFQFLIGAMKVRYYHCLSWLFKVSIPYRRNESLQLMSS